MTKQSLIEDYINLYLKTFKSIDTLISEPTLKYKLSFEQYLILRDLAAGKQLGISAIAKQRGVTRAAISRQATVLIDNGYLEQERDDNDRRRQVLRLTAPGERVAQKIEATFQERFNHWYAVLGEHDAKELLRIMNRVGDEIIAPSL